MTRILSAILMACLLTSCTPHRFRFEYDSLSPPMDDTPPAMTRTRVEAQSVTHWEIHGREPDALLILRTVLSTAAGVVTTPVWGVKTLIFGRGTPESEEAMRQRVYDRHLSSWLFGGYLWAPVDFDVLSRTRYALKPRPDGAASPMASGTQRVEAEPSVVTPRRGPLPDMLKGVPRIAPSPKNWLFATGVETYDQTSAIDGSRLTTRLFAEVAMARLGIPQDQVILLTDDGRSSIYALKHRTYPNTAASFKDQLRYLLKRVKGGDRLYVYFSGHGLPSVSDGNEPYLLLRDQSPDFIHTDAFFRLEHFLALLARSRASEIVVFLDSCFTGVSDGTSVFGTRRAATRLVPKQPGFDRKRMVVISAGGRTQFSNAHPDNGLRLFSSILMEELLKGHQSVSSLFEAIFIETREISGRMGGTRLQEPTLRGNATLGLPKGVNGAF